MQGKLRANDPKLLNVWLQMIRTFPQNFVVKHLLSYLGPSPVQKARVAHSAKASAFVNLVTVDFFIANDAIFLN